MMVFYIFREKKLKLMKVATFNIRCDYGQDGINQFCYRKSMILRKIEEEKPDVIGFQEVLPHVAVWLKENLKDYYIVGCGRSESLQDEQMSIAYRKDRMNLITFQTWWLSDTPSVPGSRYEEQSICPRTASDAVFEDMESHSIFRMINTHLDHIGAEARKKGLNQILRMISRGLYGKDVPVILCGDFNAEPNRPEMEALKQDSSLCNLTENIGITFHNYNRNDPNNPPCSIDYMVLKGDWSCEKVYKWTEEKNGVFLSDHYPVCAVVTDKAIQAYCRKQD